MTERMAGVPPENLKAFHRFVDKMLQLVKDPKEVPNLRKLLDAHERERREHERKLWAMRVEVLLSILAGRGSSGEWPPVVPGIAHQAVPTAGRHVGWGNAGGRPGSAAADRFG